jgi:hypothetical protein
VRCSTSASCTSSIGTTFGDGVELFEDLHRAFGIVAADDEFLAAAEDGDVERGRNLAQVFVERAAQVREPRVIHRLGTK